MSGTFKNEKPSIIPTYPPILAHKFAFSKLLTFLVSSMKSELWKMLKHLNHMIDIYMFNW